MHRRLLRLSTPEALAQACARTLMDRLIELQEAKETVHLALTGGRIANQMYEAFAALVPGSKLDPNRLQLWWSDERFVPLTHPDRNSQQTLAILAKTIPISPANTHLMPAVDGKADPSEAAYDYAQELGDIRFDLALLGVGPDGHVASIFPNHPSFTATGKVVGVTHAPKPPPERISLTLSAINQSSEIWVIASGADKAEAIARGFRRDQELPIGLVQSNETTLWWVDEAAAGGLPNHTCAM